MKDQLLDAQLLRTVGASVAGGADIGECLATAARVKGTDLGSWFEEWMATSARLAAIGEAELDAGRRVSACSAFLRAANYARNAGVMLLAPPIDDRLRKSNHAQTELFRRALPLLQWRSEAVEIQFENSFLPGYFFAVDDQPRPTVILIGGYDGTAEELYLLTGEAALRRGYNVLAFDGPGQGSALIQRGLTLRADFETVVSAVVDHVLQRAEVDPHRIALIGLSLGAHLAPRAASGEHRLAACIADCGSFDLHASAMERIPGPLARRYEVGDARARALLDRLLRFVASKPTAGWVLRRGQLVHGAGSALEYIDALRDFTLAGFTGQISCPTLVCNAEGDDISASAPLLVAGLQVDHEFVTFRARDGAGDHCEAGARTVFHQRAFGWLDRILSADF